MSRKKKVNDPVFYDLANKVNKILKENDGGDCISKKEFTQIQKSQVEELMKLEKDFKKAILKYKQGDTIYKKFLMFIKIKEGNILKARPYFRERAVTFGKYISPAFKEDDVDRIKDFDINFKFIQFVIENWRGNLPEKAKEAYEKHGEIRRLLIENSMPLAINEAMKFFKGVPKSHVNLMDLINSSVSGLASGVDKWVGPFRTVFRSQCIGRMVGNMMEIYNQTFLHFYPSDKKIIYKYNILRSRFKIEDENMILSIINEWLEKAGDNRVLTIYDLQDLVNSSSIVSADSEAEGTDVTIYDSQPDNNDLMDKVEDLDAMKQISSVSSVLSTMERKVIRMKGVDI